MISMAVEETLALELAHAFDLYVRFVIIGLVVPQYVLDKCRICGKNRTLHPSKVKRECGAQFAPICLDNLNRVLNHGLRIYK